MVRLERSGKLKKNAMTSSELKPRPSCLQHSASIFYATAYYAQKDYCLSSLTYFALLTEVGNYFYYSLFCKVHQLFDGAVGTDNQSVIHD
jgi:hypothetical protein